LDRRSAGIVGGNRVDCQPPIGGFRAGRGIGGHFPAAPAQFSNALTLGEVARGSEKSLPLALVIRLPEVA
jgi:hypothetical protein